jgi:hypothetical protein
MVVDHAHIMRVAAGPTEYEPPLVIDSDAVKTSKIPSQSLGSVPGWGAKVGQYLRGLEYVQLTQSSLSDIRRQASNKLLWFAMVERLRHLVAKGDDHTTPFIC